MVRFPLRSWGLSVVQQGPHGGVSVWLALVVVPLAVVEDGGLEVFGAVVFFDAEHEGHHVVVDVEEAGIQCLGGHHWLLVVVACVVGGLLVGGFPVCCELELFALSAFPVPEVVADFTDLWGSVFSQDVVDVHGYFVSCCRAWWVAVLMMMLHFVDMKK